jgi:hypothetical protein
MSDSHETTSRKNNRAHKIFKEEYWLSQNRESHSEPMSMKLRTTYLAIEKDNLHTGQTLRSPGCAEMKDQPVSRVFADCILNKTP